MTGERRIPGFTDAEHKAYLTGRAMGKDRERAAILAEVRRRIAAMQKRWPGGEKEQIHYFAEWLEARR